MEECASFSEHLNEIMDSTFEHSISSDENVNLSDGKLNLIFRLIAFEIISISNSPHR